jgi:hypothetical protein
MTEPENHEGEIRRRQKSRNLAVALLLGGMVVLFYLIAFVRIGGAASQ